MDMDFAKIMQMMNGMNGMKGGGDMSAIMQLLPQLMTNNSPAHSAPTQITLNADEVNKTLDKLYNDEK